MKIKDRKSISSTKPRVQAGKINDNQKLYTTKTIDNHSISQFQKMELFFFITFIHLSTNNLIKTLVSIKQTFYFLAKDNHYEGY